MRSSTHELQQRTAPLPARKARCLFPLFVGSVTSRTTPKKYQIVLLVVHYEYQVVLSSPLENQPAAGSERTDKEARAQGRCGARHGLPRRR